MKKKLIKVIQKPLSFIKKNWKKILIFSAIIAVIVFWKYNQVQKNKPQLTFEHPRYQDLTKVLEVSGVVDAKEKANLRFAAGGKVVYLGAKEGDEVKKWQTIATIDQRSLRTQLQQNLNNYMKERWDFESETEGYDYHVEDLDTRRTLDKTQWDLENQVLTVELNDIAITNTVLSAPFSGILVSSPTATAGVNLLATDVFELVNPDTLVFKAAVDEADVPSVSLGQAAEITLDSYPDDGISTQVSYIAYKSIPSSTGTIFVVEFPIAGENLLNKYRLGMNGDVSIELDQKDNVLTVPFEATRERDGRVLVDVRTEADQYQEREIEVGLETEDYIEVTSGLSDTDQILIPEN